MAERGGPKSSWSQEKRVCWASWRSQHILVLRNQFPFSGKMSLVFYWPISFKSPTPFPGQPRHLWAKKRCRWNSEQDNRCVKNTTASVDGMRLCWTQWLEDVCVFKCADSQLDAWVFTENLRSMRAHARLCACAWLCMRVCVSECWICASLWRTRKDGEGASLFLCRLTLSFQTHLFSKPPTISTVSPPPSLSISLIHPQYLGSCMFVWVMINL